MPLLRTRIFMSKLVLEVIEKVDVGSFGRLRCTSVLCFALHCLALLAFVLLTDGPRGPPVNVARWEQRGSRCFAAARFTTRCAPLPKTATLQFQAMWSCAGQVAASLDKCEASLGKSSHV